MTNTPDSIKDFILKNTENHPNKIVQLTEKHFKVTRTTIHRHLKHLLDQHKIIKTGTTKNTKYYLSTSLNRESNYKISKKISEDQILKNEFEDIFSRFPTNIYDICIYGFSEIVNNALDHSQGTKFSICLNYKDGVILITIIDDGIGVFKNIYDYFQLEDIRESVLQLSKGKMTTDPANHSGEGLFFSSKSFNKLEIYANNLHYFCDNDQMDWGVETIATMKKGSKIVLQISDKSKRQLVDIFKHYQDPESLAFDRTVINVTLSKFGDETLMSRAQAKRITLKLTNFNHVVLDYTGIRLVGQGFVDEIYRVFSNAHPNITFETINANDDVTFMIERGSVS